MKMKTDMYSLFMVSFLWRHDVTSRHSAGIDSLNSEVMFQNVFLVSFLGK